MAPPPRDRPDRPAPGASLALLVAILLAPPSAWAGCLHPAPSRAEGVAHFDRLASAGVLEPAGPPRRPESPRRCSGALCSRSDRDPLSPAPDPWRLGTRDLLATALLATADPGADTLPTDAEAVRPAPLVRSIFHPPRLSR